MSFRDKVEDAKEELFMAIDSRYFKSILHWIIDSKYRTSVRLSRWLKSQLNDISEELQDLCDIIPTYTDDDRQISSIFRYLEMTKGQLTYVSELESKWKRTEYWQTANETAFTMEGDCEDGAILMYVLARMKGISANRLRIMAGHVQNPYTKKIEGHAYLAYRSSYDPFHWKIMDWCYMPELLSIASRKSFFIHKNKVHLFKGDRYVPSTIYQTVWWGFNDNDVIKDFTYRIEY